MNPFNISTQNLSAPVANAVDIIVAALAAKGDQNAHAGAQVFAEVVEKLRAIGA